MSSNRRFQLLHLVPAFTLTMASVAAAQSGTSDVSREVSTLRTEVERLRAELHDLRTLVVEDRRARRQSNEDDLTSSSHADAVAEYAPVAAPSPKPSAISPDHSLYERVARPESAAITGALEASARRQDVDTQASLDLLRAQVAEIAQVKIESTSRMPVKLFGTIHTNAFANSAAANWLDSPNLVNAPPADGHNGSFSATLRQTRIGLTMDGPTLSSMRSNATVAVDFFGGIPGFVTGQVMGLPRLLVAFARLEGQRTAVEIGQDHMILAPVDPTSLASFAFPALFRSGNLYLRAPQARVEYSFGSHVKVMGGIVAPIGGDLPGEDYRFVPQAFGGERSRRPAVQARIAMTAGDRETNRHADMGVSGHYGWERRPEILARSSATAVDFTVRLDHFGAAGEFFVGENIDAFGGGTGLDARTQGWLGGSSATPRRTPVLCRRRRSRPDPRSAPPHFAAPPEPQRVRSNHLLAHPGNPGIVRISLAGDASR